MVRVRTHKRRIKGKTTQVKKHNRKWTPTPSKPFNPMPKTFHLPYENSILVPSTKDETQVDQEELKKRTQETRKKLSDLFGGYTSVKATGGYVLKDGKLVKEPVVKVTSFSTKKDYINKQREYKEYIKKKKKDWEQESIGVEHEGDMHYIE